MNEQADRHDDPAVVFIVDDEKITRESLARLLKIYGYPTVTCSSASEFLSQLPHHGASCLILDLQMPHMSGIELQQELTAMGCELPIVFLTAHGDVRTSVKAMKQGADDFLPKLADEQELVAAVERALARSADNVRHRQQQQQVSASVASLTGREREVCRYVVSGLLNKQTAKEMGISERTVKAHRANVMQKFGVESLAELVRLAEMAGITPVN